MKLYVAEQLARQLMDQHGLTDWKFLFDDAKRRFGVTRYAVKTISMSAALTSLNEEKYVVDTILHEIAHAVVGPRNGHNYRWQMKAIEIGCNGRRIYSDEVTEAEMPYTAVCPNCGKRSQYARRPKKRVACGECCRKYNGGRYSEAYIFTIIKN